MLTELSTVKARLAIDDAELRYDVLLTDAIRAVSARFDKECNRTLARTVNATHEFSGYDCELVPPCYPIESISKFEVEVSVADGWLELAGVEFLIRHSCVISLVSPLLARSRAMGRVTYTGGYVLPGTTPGAGQTALPDDLAKPRRNKSRSGFQNRDKIGLVRHWPKGGVYEEFVQTDLLLGVRAVLERYRRWTV